MSDEPVPKAPHSGHKDTVYSEQRASVSDFVFDEKVASVFDDMISRSVPLYQEVQDAAAALAKRLVRKNTTIYDLGCSTGTTLIRLTRAIEDETVSFVGVDSSAPMLEACREKLMARGVSERVALVRGDLGSADLAGAGMIILFYTLQFVAPERRLAILKRIAHGLPPGGALLLTEKIKHDAPVLQDALTELYYDFKRINGYSELEISQKREALEQVLIPLTTDENVAMLKAAGFSTVEVYLKWFTFSSFVAIR